MSEMRCTKCAFRGPTSVFIRKTTKAPHAPAVMFTCPKCRGPSVDAAVVGQAVQFTGQDTSDPGPMVIPANFFGVVVTPGDVRIEKESIAPYVAQIDSSVESCRPSIPPADIAGWKTWRVGWLSFYTNKSSIASASGDMDRARGFRTELQGWHDALSVNCKGLVPVPQQASPSTPSTIDKLTAASRTWSYVAIGAIVVGGSLVGYMIYQNMKTGGQVLQKMNFLPV